jgi:hypothetical protein
MTTPAELGLPDRLENDVRIAFPKAGRLMDYNGSRKCAIDTNCKICVGHDSGYRRSIQECQSLLCPFWTLRPYATKEQRTHPVGLVPTAEQYTELHEATISDAQRASGARLAAQRPKTELPTRIPLAGL